VDENEASSGAQLLEEDVGENDEEGANERQEAGDSYYDPQLLVLVQGII
jgi:hypothetical protein